MSEDLLIGRQLDEYRLEKLLGHGGMARVYRGVDTKLKRHVAIKVIDTPFQADSDYARRFQLEAQAIAQLEHPNIVAIYRYGEVDGLLYMAMQFIEGSDLQAVLSSYHNDHEFIEPKDLIRVLRNVADALDYAHSRGVVHRDIKPSNIMLNKREQAIVTDFGLALLTEVGTQGEILGSPHYIAPEQAISSRKAIPQSDQYALGVIIYQALTGTLPFDAPEALEVAMLHISEPPPPLRQRRPEMRAAVEAVVLKALAKEPNDRYPTCTALVDTLEKALLTATLVTAAPARLTVIERVEIQAAANPLPALESQPAAQLAVGRPPVVAPPPVTEPLPPPPQPTVTAQPTIEPQPAVGAAQMGVARQPALPALKQWGWVVGGGLALLFVVLVCGALLLGPRLGFGQNHKVYGPILFQGGPNAAAGGTPTTGPIGPVPTVVPVTIPPATSYQIAIVANNDDGLFIFNRGTTALPLAALTLASEKAAVLGAGWQLESLAPRACVAVWKDAAAPQLPAGVQCAVAGTPQIVGNVRDLWSPALRIQYNNAEVGQCTKNVVCVVVFP